MKRISTSLLSGAGVVLLMWCIVTIAEASPLPASGARAITMSRFGGGDPSGNPNSPLPAAPDVIYATPDTLVDPHWKDFRLPIYLRNPNARPVCAPDDLSLTVYFNATLFFPRSVTRGSITGTRLVGDTMFVDISVAGTPAVTHGVITELVGDVLLGNEQSTIFYLLARCAGGPVGDSVYSGNMYESPGFCEEGSDRLLVYRDGFRINKIVPNPVRSGTVSVHLSTLETEETFLEIYASDGARVFATSWVPASMGQQDLTRDIVLPESLSSGTYTVVLRSPARRDAQTLIISR